MPHPKSTGSTFTIEPVLTPDRLNRLLGPSWPFGEISASSEQRIGAEFGFGGAVHLVRVVTKDGRKTLVSKEETPEQVERVVAAYGEMASPLAGLVPTLYGWSDTTTLFEYVTPAAQGDGLYVETWQVDRMLELLARLHAATWSKDKQGWVPEHWTENRWAERLELASHRYPDQMADELRQRLAALHVEIPGAIEVLRRGPRALVHLDSGYDNTLWRPDGSIVLLDWASARHGPPAYDVAGHLMEGDPGSVIEAYRDGLLSHGITMPTDVLIAQLLAALKVMVRGMVGFAGSPDEPRQPRLLEFRDRVLPRVRRELAWIDETNR